MSDFLQRLFKIAGTNNQSEIARQLNIPNTTLSNWVTRGVSKGGALKISQTYGVNIDYILNGKSTNNNSQAHPSYDNAQVIQKQQKKAPVLNWVQAGSFTDIGSDGYSDYLPYFGDYGNDRVYWLRIRGESMLPDFKEGEYILINADRQPVAGNFVAALQYGEEKATFKKYRPKGFDDKGVEYWHLVPSNDEYPIIDSRYQPFDILGVAVERNQKLV